MTQDTLVLSKHCLLQRVSLRLEGSDGGIWCGVCPKITPLTSDPSPRSCTALRPPTGGPAGPVELLLSTHTSLSLFVLPLQPSLPPLPGYVCEVGYFGDCRESTKTVLKRCYFFLLAYLYNPKTEMKTFVTQLDIFIFY